MYSTVPVLSFIGWSNSGKTTLLEKLIPLLLQRGWRVGVVKHSHLRNLEVDLPGKDSRRLWDTGAAQTVLWMPDRVVYSRRCEHAPTLEEILATVSGLDLILVEGYKQGAWPKIEVIRAARDARRIPDIENCVACVTDVPDLCGDSPCFHLDDVEALADFIATFVTQRPLGEAQSPAHFREGV
ncbi:MAG: molybdopterin-guanine dinucleotide biosynthesis protein B [Anaerolineae bacterium]|nr:molybdopterin-guanine dinucleotide biosynthesis protein B [Anaerolineae bacterium]